MLYFRVSTCGGTVTRVSNIWAIEKLTIKTIAILKVEFVTCLTDNFVFVFLQNCTYIESPGYPSDYSTSGDCSYTVNRCQDGKKCR